MSQESLLDNVGGNIPEFSVSDLAFSVKRTMEDTYGRVRVRGELSRISIPKSGHLYSQIKDDKAVIKIVCWKGVVSKLSIHPEEGMDVICTGKMTTYPGNSEYQLVIESIELAGEGALLKMLEDRKKKLAAEGLFAAERKQTIPFLPTRIGVVTSPTGAVIRDILHRLADRFPRHVLVWPVKVQGQGSAEEITNAIHGFNALSAHQKPDVLIIARGGGSLEDLMPFNEENVVRAVAASTIPVISAVGHETDTTLIDYVSDVRAPTPTGAAEMAVPVRMNLLAQVKDDEQRLISSMSRMLKSYHQQIETMTSKLGDPTRLLELKIQAADRASEKLNHSLQSLINVKRQKYTERSARLNQPSNLITAAQHSLSRWSEQIDIAAKRNITEKEKSLSRALEKLEILSFENVLKRGYVVVRDDQGKPITQPDTLKTAQNIDLQFQGNKHVQAQITSHKTKKPAKKSQATVAKQDTLF